MPVSQQRGEGNLMRLNTKDLSFILSFYSLRCVDVKKVTQTQAMTQKLLGISFYYTHIKITAIRGVKITIIENNQKR